VPFCPPLPLNIDHRSDDCNAIEPKPKGVFVNWSWDGAAVHSIKDDANKDVQKCNTLAPKCEECGVRICSFCNINNWDHETKTLLQDAYYDPELLTEHFADIEI
jgi:hypothetical protein